MSSASFEVAEDESKGTTSIDRAVEQLARNCFAGGTERRYFGRDSDIGDFIPTKDTTSYWLQCFTGGDGVSEENPDYYRINRLEGHYRGMEQSDLDHDLLRREAIECRLTVGKWMLKVTEDHVDDMWRAIALGVRDGSLGRGADSVKCATRRNAASNVAQECCYTICVYTNGGLTNKDVVMELREGLRDLGIDRKCIRPLFWKPDFYTHLPLKGATYLWLDGVDTEFWYDHWNGTTIY